MEALADELAGVPTTCERGSVDQLDPVSKGTHGLPSDRWNEECGFFCAQRGIGDKRDRPSPLRVASD